MLTNPETGRLYSTGEKMRRPDLAAALRLIQQDGPRAVTDGEIMADMLSAIKEAGGIIDRNDFKSYRVVSRPPLVTSYQNFQLLLPPPSTGMCLDFLLFCLSALLPLDRVLPPRFRSAGGLILGLIMNVLETFDFHGLFQTQVSFSCLSLRFFFSSFLPSLLPPFISLPVVCQEAEHFSGPQLHQLVEAFKFGFPHKGFVADPAFVSDNEVLSFLLTKEFARNLSATISSQQTYPPEWSRFCSFPFASFCSLLFLRIVCRISFSFVPVCRYGLPFSPSQEKLVASHVSVMTRHQTVSLSTTVNHAFGSRLVSPRFGIVLNNAMVDFTTTLEPNARGVSSPEVTNRHRTVTFLLLSAHRVLCCFRARRSTTSPPANGLSLYSPR
jgi:gamma-glutamyltranspeptidase